MASGGSYLQQVIGRVQDALLPAAQQRLDQLLGHCRLLVDDGQVQRTVGKLQIRLQPPTSAQPPVKPPAGLTDVSPLASWTPHRCLWTASRTRVSPELQYCARAAAAACRARWDAPLWRALAGETRGHMVSVHRRAVPLVVAATVSPMR